MAIRAEFENPDGTAVDGYVFNTSGQIRRVADGVFVTPVDGSAALYAHPTSTASYGNWWKFTTDLVLTEGLYYVEARERVAGAASLAGSPFVGFSLQVNAAGEEVGGATTTADITAIWSKAMTELTAVPGVTASALSALNFVFTALRNRVTETSTQRRIYRDDGSTVLGTATISDDGSTFVHGEYS